MFRLPINQLLVETASTPFLLTLQVHKYTCLSLCPAFPQDSSTSLRSSGQAAGGVSFRKAIYDTLATWTGDAQYEGVCKRDCIICAQQGLH